MADIEEQRAIAMAIAEDSMFSSRIQEFLTRDKIWLVRNGPTKLADYLYLGSNSDAQNLERVKSLGITHIINCAGKTFDQSEIYLNEPSIMMYHAINAEDTDNYDMLRHFPDVQTIIDNARQCDGKVLIHCELGINRSCVLCMAHLMLECGVYLMDMFETMKSLRGLCVVNIGFQLQLIKFARKHGLLHPNATTQF